MNTTQKCGELLCRQRACGACLCIRNHSASVSEKIYKTSNGWANVTAQAERKWKTIFIVTDAIKYKFILFFLQFNYSFQLAVTFDQRMPNACFTSDVSATHRAALLIGSEVILTQFSQSIRTSNAKIHLNIQDFVIMDIGVGFYESGNIKTISYAYAFALLFMCMRACVRPFSWVEIVPLMTKIQFKLCKHTIP